MQAVAGSHNKEPFAMLFDAGYRRQEKPETP